MCHLIHYIFYFLSKDYKFIFMILITHIQIYLRCEQKLCCREGKGFRKNLETQIFDVIKNFYSFSLSLLSSIFQGSIELLNCNFLEKNLRGKWRNIRDYFMKELKLQKSHKSGPAGRKRKKYMYFDRLLFLMPTVENRRYRLSLKLKINVIDAINRSIEFESLFFFLEVPGR